MKNTADILAKLIILDFKSLCTSISNIEMIKPVKDSFGIHSSENKVPKVVTTL